MKTKLLFFPEYNLTTGKGHLNRLLAFAEQVKNNYEVEFIFISTAPKTISFNYFTLKKSNSIIDEINSLSQEIDHRCAALVLDGYHFNQDYQKKLKQKIDNVKLIYVDDLAGKQCYADVVINHAPGAKPIHYQVSKKTRLLLGTKYLMLRKEFLNQYDKVYTPVKGSVFICFGGLDEENWTKYFVKQLVKIDQVKQINVVLGEGYKYAPSLFEHAKINCYKQLSSSEIKKQMELSELLVIPSSTISLEALALNKTFVSVKTVDNQKYIHEGWKGYNQVYPIDVSKKIDTEEVKRWILNQLDNMDLNGKKENYSPMLGSVIPELLSQNKVNYEQE